MLDQQARSAIRGIMHKLAIYDMDKTITQRATLMPFLFYACVRTKPWRLVLLPLVALASAAYGIKLIDRARLKEINLRLMLGRKMPLHVAGGFARSTLAQNVCAGARTQIAADKAAGYQLVMATASCRFYAAEIAALLGFDATIATENAALSDGSVLYKITGENCYDEAKLRAVKAWTVGQGIMRDDAHIRFYSDHVSDAPCLEYADEGFATNAHPPLREMAKARGWTVVDWA